MTFEGNDTAKCRATTRVHTEKLKTRANTPFIVWWEALDALADVRFSDARGYYDTGHSPETAAADAKVVAELRTGGRL